jgi:hypothetical protein
MQIRTTLALALAAGASTVASASEDRIPIALAPTCDEVVCSHTALAQAQAEAQARTTKLIEAQTFFALPVPHQAAIAEKLVANGEPVPSLTDDIDFDRHPGVRDFVAPMDEAELNERWELVKDFTSRDAFERFTPMQRRMLSNFAEMATQPDWVPVMTCFQPGTDTAYMLAFEAIISYGLSNGTSIQFEQTARWNGTALDPSGGGQGNPTILTYSFPPDGATVPSGVGEPQAPNDLNAFLDSRYGSRAAWRQIYADMFNRWGELSGNTYVLEPADDGVTLFNNPGVSGVRGDLRMAGKFIDGNSGTLAYNFFPQNGDMVIDTGDSFYNGNVLRLENVLSHEHGHGMGQLHTCPVTNSKLMEPFINLNFDGPQFDDILNAQRHYGDPNEPNDNVGSATGIGSLANGDSTTITTVSIDDDLDVDVYTFTLTEPAELNATLRVRGSQYQAGPQTGSCNENQPYNPTLFLDPAIEILDSNGSTVLASADANPAGGDETATASLTPGTYFIRATGGSPSGDQIIAYALDVSADFDALSFNQVAPPPTEFAPGVATSYDIEISPDGEAFLLPPTVAFRRAGDANFTEVLLTDLGNNLYRANFPAFDCGDDPEYFFTAIGTISGNNNFPDSGFINAVVSDGTSISFNDNGQVDLGYTVSGNAGDGQWTLGVPVNNDRGDPPADFDGSGSCWLTDNNPSNDNSDVDDGETVLTSPALDLVAGSQVSYAYWFNDIAGGPVQGGDTFRVQVSTNGGSSYSTVRTVSSAEGAWRTDTLVAGVDYSPSAAGQGRLRFIANDIGTQNVIEAGVDAIVVSTSTCTDPSGCNPADLAEPFGELTFGDISAFLAAFNSQDPAADLASPFGEFTFGDISAFLGAFSAGCP